MTLVPGEAGTSRTRQAPKRPSISWVMVLPLRLKFSRCFFASFWAFSMAIGTLLALPYPDLDGLLAITDDHQRAEAEAPAALDRGRGAEDAHGGGFE